jgi:hypothetical protein
MKEANWTLGEAADWFLLLFERRMTKKSRSSDWLKNPLQKTSDVSLSSFNSRSGLGLSLPRVFKPLIRLGSMKIAFCRVQIRSGSAAGDYPAVGPRKSDLKLENWAPELVQRRLHSIFDLACSGFALCLPVKIS